MNKILIVLLITPFILVGQNNNEDKTVEIRHGRLVEAGIELNVIPYLYAGYHGSFWLSYKKVRFKGTISEFSPYEFVINNLFNDLTIRSYEFDVAYFPIGIKNWIDRLWFEAGGAYWDNLAVNQNNNSGTFQTWMLNLGVGYIWTFSNNFYLNPSFHGHLRVAGDREVIISGDKYKTQFFTPEISLIIGYHF